MNMQIRLNEIRIFARHGVLEDERTLGAWFRVSLCAEADCTEAMHTDQLQHTVNYAEMADIVRQQMATPSRLLENVAWRIANNILESMPLVQSIEVTVHKEHPPVCVECESSSITLQLKR